MPRYLVERYLSDGAGVLTGAAGRAVAEGNTDVGVVWLHSYVFDDDRRVYCLYEAPNPEAIRKAARRVGLHIQAIHRITIMEPNSYVRPSATISR